MQKLEQEDITALTGKEKDSLKPRRSWLVPSVLIAVLALVALTVSFKRGGSSVDQNLSAAGATPDASGATKSIEIDMTKTEWPELVGKPGEEAMAIIQQENPTMTTVVLVPEGSMVTMDYREDRVRIFVKDDGTVASTPRMG